MEYTEKCSYGLYFNNVNIILVLLLLVTVFEYGQFDLVNPNVIYLQRNIFPYCAILYTAL